MSERLERAAERMRQRVMTMPLELRNIDDYISQRTLVLAVAKFGCGKFATSIWITPEAQQDIPAKFIEEQLRHSFCRRLISDIAFIKPVGRLPD